MPGTRRRHLGSAISRSGATSRFLETPAEGSPLPARSFYTRVDGRSGLRIGSDEPLAQPLKLLFRRGELAAAGVRTGSSGAPDGTPAHRIPLIAARDGICSAKGQR